MKVRLKNILERVAPGLSLELHCGIWVCTGECRENNSDTVESLGLTGSGKLGRSRQLGEILVGDVHPSPLLLTLKGETAKLY